MLQNGLLKMKKRREGRHAHPLFLLNYYEIKRFSFKFGDLKMNRFIVFEVAPLEFSSISLNKRTKKGPFNFKDWWTWQFFLLPSCPLFVTYLFTGDIEI
jgi:hypothetical protein